MKWQPKNTDDHNYGNDYENSKYILLANIHEQRPN